MMDYINIIGEILFPQKEISSILIHWADTHDPDLMLLTLSAAMTHLLIQSRSFNLVI